MAEDYLRERDEEEAEISAALPNPNPMGDRFFFREGQTLGRGMPVEVLMQED